MRAAVVGVIICGAITILKNALCPEGGPDGLAIVGFCLGLVVYHRKKIPPMTFMLAMGGICGGLRLLSLYFSVG